MLPFLIQSQPGAAPESEPALEEFRLELIRNHRVAEYVRPQADPQWQALAGDIFSEILRTLLDLQFRDAGQDGDEDSDADGEETTRLRNLREQPMAELASMLSPPLVTSVQDALSQPRALEAFEQMNEARNALLIGERRIAERHLRCAAELRPLDPAAAEWLARVLISSGRKKAELEAIDLAVRAARIYANTDKALRAAASLVLAARASSGHDRGRAIDYARAAIEQAGWYAQTHFELARQLSFDSQAGGALASLERAFNCHPPIIEAVYNDPAFEQNRQAVDGFIDAMHQRVGSVIEGVLASETAMIARLGLAQRTTRDLSSNARLWRRVYACRDAVRRQMHELQTLAASYLSGAAMNLPNGAAVPVYVLEASSLRLHTQDTLQINFLVAAGASVEKGEPVFQYQSANSRVSRTWHAPVALRLVWATRTASLLASDNVLTWSPVPEYTTAAEHRNRKADEQRALAQSQQQHADMNAQRAVVKRKLIAGIVIACAGAVAAYLLRAQTVPALLLGMGTMYAVHVGNQLWQQHTVLRDAIDKCAVRILGNARQIEDEQRNLDALQRIENDRLALLQEMVALFERDALSLVAVSMPFQGLRSSRKNDWVVVALSSVKKYAGDFGASLAVQDSPRIPTQPGKLSLMRVARRDGGQIILDRAAAYLPRQA